ncbi:hypothetical protein GUITHDRAFT_103238 [Guillardia theta CCMP2712]|uniref:Uncharacterized protein n=1 Tax=Guillardia theta (strain CCMP2712) TaxID=905079 RepID=L1JS01_GUITC|nr:hypothetical protein GUITHDRAFT_103238 [Guillardia theta CCMP2712]EKX51321.1 hypothetical protein GUITHDRAFT_103238 [Guillardia theta CCMP2712]|eukprot:XP_005838301.1 hypothetical protein GUITHDRAFT_103238 [Guillardia theta CCMP2712]
MPRRKDMNVMLVMVSVGIATALVALAIKGRTGSILASRGNLDEQMKVYKEAERAIDHQQKVAWKGFKRARARVALDVRDAPNRLAGTQSFPPPSSQTSGQGGSNRLAGFSASGKDASSDDLGTSLLHLSQVDAHEMFALVRPVAADCCCTTSRGRFPLTVLLHVKQLDDSIGSQPVKKIKIKIDEHKKPKVVPVKFSKETVNLFKTLEEQAHTGLQQPRKNGKLYAKADSIMSINTHLPPSKAFVDLKKQVEDIGFEQDRFHYNK